MPSPNALAGTAYLYVDGLNFLLAGDFTWSPSRVERETMVGMDSVHGYSEKPHTPFIEGTLRDTGGLPVAAFDDMTNVTVIAELASGKVITGRNMWTVQPRDVNSTDATVKVRWEGPSVVESLV